MSSGFKITIKSLLVESSVEWLAYFCQIKPYFVNTHVPMHGFKGSMYTMKKGEPGILWTNGRDNWILHGSVSFESIGRNLLLILAMWLLYFASCNAVIEMPLDENILLKVKLFSTGTAAIASWMMVKLVAHRTEFDFLLLMLARKISVFLDCCIFQILEIEFEITWFFSGQVSKCSSFKLPTC